MLANLGLPTRPRISRWLTYALLAGLFTSLPTAVITAPKASANSCISTSTTIDTQTVVSFTEVQNCLWGVPSGVTAVRVLVVGGGGWLDVVCGRPIGVVCFGNQGVPLGDPYFP